jgi:hypothetical protein
MVLVDSVATDGEGVREAFVVAVRLALDRTRALASEGGLAHGPPEDDTPQDLLDRLRSLDHDSGSPVMSKRSAALGDVERLLPEPHDSGTAWTPGEEDIFVPDPMMPGGRIWPPVDGRTLLHEIAHLGLSPLRTARADWWASGFGWRFHSAGSAVFPDLYEARQRLIDWARQHAGHADLPSRGRALILADAGRLGQRMWQLVQTEAALRDRLADATLNQPHELVGKLQRIGEQLLRARALLARSSLGLRCTLWTVSADVDSQPRFVGLTPGPLDPPRVEPEGSDLLARELAPRLRALEQEHPDFAAVRELLHAQAMAGDLVARTLGELA